MSGLRILIVESRQQGEIVDNLVKGAVNELTAVGAGYKRLFVPGLLEIPEAVRFVIRSMELRATDERYSGYLALGCALRGGQDEYAARLAIEGLHRLALEFTLAVGDGIVTAADAAQAQELCAPERRNLGGQAARTCLRMLDIKRELSLIPK